MPSAEDPVDDRPRGDAEPDWLSNLHPYGPALFPWVRRPARRAQPYVVKLTALKDGAFAFALNEGGLGVAAARAGIAYRSGPRVRAQAAGFTVLTEDQAIGWMRARRRRSGWEAA